MRRLVPVICSVALTLATGGCGGGSATSPSVIVQPTYAISGKVIDALTSQPVTSAVVKVIDGASAGASTHVNADGIYRLFGMTGSPRLEVQATGYAVATLQIASLTANVTADVSLERGATSFAGRVTETAPTTQVIIAGATIEIISGPLAGQKTVSAADGTFALTGLTEAADVMVRAAGYEDSRLRVGPGSGIATGDVRLMPLLKTLTRTIGTYDGPSQPPGSFFLDVHHAGAITVSRLYDAVDDFHAKRTVEVWNGARLVASSTVTFENSYFVALEAHVDGGARYEVRVLGGNWNTVTMEWPN